VQLQALLAHVSDVQVLNDVTTTGVETSNVTADSRKIQPGSIFVALEGGKSDGHLFLEQAAQAGATALVIRAGREKALPLPHGITIIAVPDPRKAIAEIGAALHDFPGQKMRLIGVTGTNGKTTVTHLIERMLSDQGESTGLIGTLGQKTNRQKAFDDTGHTTPMAAELQEILADMHNEGTTSVVMEVSSHALEQYRVHGCHFSVAVLTNLTQDHLDYHKTMAQYWQAKALLFSRLDAKGFDGKPPTAVINLDSDYAKEFIAACPKGITVRSYAIDAPAADVSIRNAEYSTAGSTFTVKTPAGEAEVHLKLGGRFSVYNALAALTVGLALDIPLDEAVKSLEAVIGIPGRFEAVATNPYVIVDYAHTPDGLQNVLQAARAILPEKGRLIAVFGCGGDRDATKRPKMGRIAEELADHLVITSDNPRSEDPQQILTDIISGIRRFEANRMTVDADRLQAIRQAIDLAKADDIVVIAGKGHEDYQILADRTIHFDDREVVRDYVKYKYAGLST
jgi:UDP-N-acetylmuramoyl-L-alanyl-D-glutamate--2,6-diaminopimelate ligase